MFYLIFKKGKEHEICEKERESNFDLIHAYSEFVFIPISLLLFATHESEKE
jgi:hypothetical protein